MHIFFPPSCTMLLWLLQSQSRGGIQEGVLILSLIERQAGRGMDRVRQRPRVRLLRRQEEKQPTVSFRSASARQWRNVAWRRRWTPVVLSQVAPVSSQMCCAICHKITATTPPPPPPCSPGLTTPVCLSAKLSKHQISRTASQEWTSNEEDTQMPPSAFFPSWGGSKAGSRPVPNLKPVIFLFKGGPGILWPWENKLLTSPAESGVPGNKQI